MSRTHFYLTLPSNASSDMFPDNKTTSYRVKLPQTIDLEGNSRPRKVWRRYCYNVYQHPIRTSPNEILRSCGSAFKERHGRSRAIRTRENGDNTALQTAYLFHMKNNPYTHYYLGQQGRGMSVFRGSPWQIGHGQKGYGLGALFRTVAGAAMPLVKRGAKALGNIALNTGVIFASDVLAGKNVKQAAKARALEGVNTAKRKPYSDCRGMLKPDKDGNGQEVQPKRERHLLRQAGAPVEREKPYRPNAKLKRERHPYR